YHIALIALREGRFRRAVRQMQLLIEDHGAHYGAFVNMAAAPRYLNRPEDSLLALEEAERLRPTEARTQLERAMTMVHAQRFDDALQSFAEYRRRLRRDQRPAPEYFYYCALTMALREELNAADALVSEGLDVHPDAAPLLLLAGLVSE